MRKIATFIVLLLLSISASARRHSQFFEKKFFPATALSLSLENERADRLGLGRVSDMRDLQALVARNVFAPLVGVEVSPRLPKDRRYALPETVQYLEKLNADFRERFGHGIVIDSVVRPASVQERLRHWNHNAAPVGGERASTHERGTTADISRRFLTRREYHWMVLRLMYDRAVGRILVIEERACLHVFVGGVDGL
ncbi:MAG: hypothetical protein C5B59_08825 [Bacteroidetes bacterium]|nr:MAG: hypothetical protein C5B59_08825 [Bacteroidota bacterium]